jgi:hypothetical protein
MAPTPIPGGVVAFENFHATAIQDNGRVLFAVLTKNRDGCVVFDKDRILWEATGNDFGAPSIQFRPGDGALTLTSCMKYGTVMYYERVPGVFKDGRLP